MSTAPWPRLRVDDWAATRETLHMYTQIVGKARMACTPLVNHWWNSTLYVTARGLTTGAIPAGDGVVDVELDLVGHRLTGRSSGGAESGFALEGQSVARFYEQALALFADLGLDPVFQPAPNEVDPAVPFAEDTADREYDAEAVHTFWQQLVRVDRVMGEFRARFAGKVSPVHFYWGSLDMACTRFSGHSAPPHPGGAPNCADWVMVEAYDRELCSCGFWPGGGDEGAFYAYAYPTPDGFADRGLTKGHYSTELGEFVLPYEEAADSADPEAVVLTFLQETYEAAADLAGWDRDALEVDPHRLDSHRYRGVR